MAFPVNSLYEYSAIIIFFSFVAGFYGCLHTLFMSVLWAIDHI